MITKLDEEVNMLDRHVEILRLVIDNEPIGIVTMSNETGYAHHKVRYSLRILEEENLIDPSSQGAITTEQTNEFVEKLDTRLDEVESKLIEMKIENPVNIEN
jgi:predicted transcriptional regulator